MKKKNVLIWLVVAVIMFFLGGVLITVGIGLGADVSKSSKYFNINMTGELTMVTGESEKYNDVKNIDLDVDNLRVEFMQSTDENYYIEYSVYDDYVIPKITYDNGTLKVKQEQRSFFINLDLTGLFANREEYIKIYVPQNAKLNDIDVCTSNGRIDVKQQINVDSIKLDTNNGSINVEDVTCEGKVDIKTSNGAVKCDGTFTDEFNVKTSNGAVTLKGTYKGDVDVKTSNGRIKAEIDGKFSDYNVSLDTSNGSIVVNGEKRSDDYQVDHDADNDIKLDTSNGSIDLDFQ